MTGCRTGRISIPTVIMARAGAIREVQSLTPQGPQPFESFRDDHFCRTWEPLLTFNNGNEPEQP